MKLRESKTVNTYEIHLPVHIDVHTYVYMFMLGVRLVSQRVHMLVIYGLWFQKPRWVLEVLWTFAAFDSQPYG